jgi:hypothetical protein
VLFLHEMLGGPLDPLVAVTKLPPLRLPADKSDSEIGETDVEALFAQLDRERKPKEAYDCLQT